jgi:anti-sigma-K factor RskA
MASTPVDEHTEEFEQLAGLSALDVLEGEERDRFEAHAARCERCRLMVRLDREALALAAPEMDPSPDFKNRLMQRAADELAASEAATAPLELEQRQREVEVREPVPLRPYPPNVIPFWRRSRVPSVLAAVFAIALVSAGAFTYQNQVVASYALSGSVSGSAVVNVRRSGAAELDMRGVQNPSPGFVYEAWIIPRGGDPVAVGVTPTGDATLPLQGLSSGATVAITQERARVDAPTSQPILAAVVQS